MTQTAIATSLAQIQQLLERDYPHLEWRVLFNPAPAEQTATEPWLFVHARTRDFRTRCRVGRPWTVVAASPTLRMLVAELAAEAEQALVQASAE